MVSLADKEMMEKLAALGPDDPATPINGCHCDFCTRKKKYSDNWCSFCGNVKMDPLTKNWENMDICDDCERKQNEEEKVQEA